MPKPKMRDVPPCASTYSVWAYNRFRAKKYATVPRTTLYTEEGPACGTIWIMLAAKSRPAVTEKLRTTWTVIGLDARHVWFDNDRKMTRKAFRNHVNGGVAALIGIDNRHVLSSAPFLPTVIHD